MLLQVEHIHALNSLSHHEKSVADDNEQSKIKPRVSPLWALAVADTKWPATPHFYFFINRRRTWVFQYELGSIGTNRRGQQKCDITKAEIRSWVYLEGNRKVSKKTVWSSPLVALDM